MNSIKINLAGNIGSSYKIIIGEGLISIINSFIKVNGYDHAAIITDDKVYGIFKNHLKKIRCSKILHFKSGEQNKGIETYKDLCLQLFEFGLTRKSLIIAFGGGVVGDMAGQIAATYMRGIDYIQVPTTLLAMVDSSIGGKTGFDLGNGKNIIGSFYQPKKVFIDVGFLEKLPRKEFLNGVAEIIKYAIIKDNGLFNLLADCRKKLMGKDKKFLIDVIETCCNIKKSIVEDDEKELNLRKILNFGHTLGHAIEACSGYKIPHGEAIAIGMCLEATISNKLDILPESEMHRIVDLIKSFGLPTKMAGYDTHKLIGIMRKDKKSQQNKLVFVIPEKVGLMKSINGSYGIVVENGVVEGVIEKK